MFVWQNYIVCLTKKSLIVYSVKSFAAFHTSESDKQNNSLTTYHRTTYNSNLVSNITQLNSKTEAI